MWPKPQTNNHILKQPPQQTTITHCTHHVSVPVLSGRCRRVHGLLVCPSSLRPGAVLAPLTARAPLTALTTVRHRTSLRRPPECVLWPLPPRSRRYIGFAQFFDRPANQPKWGMGAGRGGVGERLPMVKFRALSRHWRDTLLWLSPKWPQLGRSLIEWTEECQQRWRGIRADCRWSAIYRPSLQTLEASTLAGSTSVGQWSVRYDLLSCFCWTARISELTTLLDNITRWFADFAIAMLGTVRRNDKISFDGFCQRLPSVYSAFRREPSNI